MIVRIVLNKVMKIHSVLCAVVVTAGLHPTTENASYPPRVRKLDNRSSGNNPPEVGTFSWSPPRREG